MKIQKLTAILVAGGLVMATATSCGDKFLTVDNPTAQPIEEYFTTEAHLSEAMVAAYSPLFWTDWSDGQYAPIILMSDIMADQIWVGGADATDNKFWHLMANYSAVPTDCLTSVWSEYYSGVKRCNDVLKYKGWVENLPESVAKSYEAQARVLRVYYYSWMWKFWGNIVYYEENLQYPYTGDQFPADEVYAKMMADLEGAIALNALPMYWEGIDIGRVSLSMAYMLYAELAMYQKDESRLPKALEYMKAIIADPHFALDPDYAHIFTKDGEWSSESIFEIDYKDADQIRSYDDTKQAGGTWLPQLISPNNLKNQGSYAGGWGFGPVMTATYKMYGDGDVRRDATCMVATGTYDARYQDTGLFLEKYVAKAEYRGSTGAGDCQFGNNFRMYRYAETLLNAAELVVGGYGQGEAKTWLNLVHKRAGLTDEIEATLENIKQERRLEFVGEGKRYWDLIRWGDAASTLVPCEDEGFTDLARSKGRSGSWSEAKKYLPIPQSEIDASQNTLKQNPGY